MSISGSSMSSSGAGLMQLPVAESRRWKPLRSGLLSLYRYENEEFWFEQGRLLLRGNNGTGKSRVLALQLPFLLDGETAPQHLRKPVGGCVCRKSARGRECATHLRRRSAQDRRATPAHAARGRGCSFDISRRLRLGRNSDRQCGDRALWRDPMAIFVAGLSCGAAGRGPARTFGCRELGIGAGGGDARVGSGRARGAGIG